MAISEVDLNEFHIDQSGYQRFFNDIDNLDEFDNAIITVRREEQITAQFTPHNSKSKIKISLSQEQIVNRLNGLRPEITRSQSINIKHSCEFPKNPPRSVLSRQNSLKPSMIPIKLKESSGQLAKQLDTAVPQPPGSMIPRKLSVSTDKRQFNSQQELKGNASVLSMTHSMDRAFEMRRLSEARHNLSERFKCSFCLNIVNDPRVLDCLHTFCLECLYGIENTNQTKTIPNKTHITTNNEAIDGDGASNHSNSNNTKETTRRLTKLSMVANSANPIKKIFFSMPRKRTDDRKVCQIQ